MQLYCDKICFLATAETLPLRDGGENAGIGLYRFRYNEIDFTQN
jgi:hypothetical protein